MYNYYSYHFCIDVMIFIAFIAFGNVYNHQCHDENAVYQEQERDECSGYESPESSPGCNNKYQNYFWEFQVRTNAVLLLNGSCIFVHKIEQQTDSNQPNQQGGDVVCQCCCTVEFCQTQDACQVDQVIVLAAGHIFRTEWILFSISIAVSTRRWWWWWWWTNGDQSLLCCAGFSMLSAFCYDITLLRTYIITTTIKQATEMNPPNPAPAMIMKIIIAEDGEINRFFSVESMEA